MSAFGNRSTYYSSTCPGTTSLLRPQRSFRYKRSKPTCQIRTVRQTSPEKALTVRHRANSDRAEATRGEQRTGNSHVTRM